jgi:hypothetical protein
MLGCGDKGVRGCADRVKKGVQVHAYRTEWKTAVPVEPVHFFTTGLALL